MTPLDHDTPKKHALALIEEYGDEGAVAVASRHQTDELDPRVQQFWEKVLEELGDS